MKRFAAWIGQFQWPWRATVFVGALWVLFWGGHPSERLMARTPDATPGVLAKASVPVPLRSPDCEEETIQVKLNPVCPLSGEEGPASLSLESAKHPLLAVEMREYPKDSVSAHFGVSDEHFIAAAGLPIPGLPRQPQSEVLAQVDLQREDLLTPQFKKELELRYDRPVQGKRMLAMFVCDDTNRNGRCSDEKSKGQIAVRSPVHQACALPRQIPIAIRAGCP